MNSPSKDQSASMKQTAQWEKNQTILCESKGFHYEAKIVSIMEKDGVRSYRVHYKVSPSSAP